MKRKINLLLVTTILTIIIFGFSIYAQRKLVDYVPTIKCLVLVEDVESYEKLDEKTFKEVDMPMEIVTNTKVVTSFGEISGLYAKQKLYKGQVAVKEAFDTKENLSIFECDGGLEKISVKIKSSENGVSYQLKENSRVNIYATIRTELANKFLDGKKKIVIGNAEDGYTIIELLENVKVLGVFDEDGIQIIQNRNDAKPDTIMIAVNNDEAMQINLIREFANFNISEIGIEREMEVQNETVPD